MKNSRFERFTECCSRWGKKAMAIALVFLTILNILVLVLPQNEINWINVNASSSSILSSLSSLTCSSYVSNKEHREYIDRMMQYYISTNNDLINALDTNKNVIFMFEGGSDNYPGTNYSANSYSSRDQAIVIVVRADSSGKCYIAFCDHNCTSIPDAPDIRTDRWSPVTLNDGIYSVKTRNHHNQYGALSIRYSVNGVSTLNDRQGKPVTINPSDIDIHTRAQATCYAYNPWSAGCQLIGKSSTRTNTFNTFMKVVAQIDKDVWVDYYASPKKLYTITENQDVGYYVLDRQLAVDGLKKIYTENAISLFTQFSSDAKSKAYGSDIGTGLYMYIRSEKTENYLGTVEGNSTENVVSIPIYPEEENYLWYLVRQSNGRYVIHHVQTGKVMDVCGAKTASGTNVYLWPYSPNNPAQEWSLVEKEDGYMLVSALDPNVVLDAAGGGISGGYNVQVWSKHSNDTKKHQRFTFELARPEGTPPPSVPLGDDFYGIIYNTKQWKPIENRSERVVFSASESGRSNQLWYFERQEDGTYVIYSTLDGKALTADTEDKNGARIYVDTFGWDSNQKWRISKNGDGYALSPDSSERLLDIAGGTTTDGTKIQLYDKNGHWAQVWSIYNQQDAYLSAPTLSLKAGTADTKTEFSWNNVSGETGYDLYIYKDEYYQGDLVLSQENITDTSFSVQLEPGTYQAAVEAYHYMDHLLSNIVTFTVVDDNAPVKTIYYNGHIYSLVPSTTTWSRAYDYCANAGSYLATITSEAEQNAVKSLLDSSSDTYYWIGLNDAYLDDTYEWSTGEAFSYNNWGSQQPTTSRADEDYIALSGDGKWFDLTEKDGHIGGYIMETDVAYLEPVRSQVIGNSYYQVFSDLVPWSAAEAYARQLGGHLVTLNSAEENAAVSQLLNDVHPLGHEEMWYWTAASDIGRDTFDYVWTNGEEMNYDNWVAPQPDNFIGIENYLAIKQDEAWCDFALQGYLMSGNGFVVEYPLSALPEGLLMPKMYVDVVYHPDENKAVAEISVSAAEFPIDKGFCVLAFDDSVLTPAESETVEYLNGTTASEEIPTDGAYGIAWDYSSTLPESTEPLKTLRVNFDVAPNTEPADLQQALGICDDPAVLEAMDAADLGGASLAYEDTTYCLEENDMATVWTFRSTGEYFINVDNGTATVDNAEAAKANSGDTVTVTAETPAAGYRFKEWQIVSGSPALTSATSATTTFTMPEANVSLKAVYELVIDPEISYYNVSVIDGTATVNNQTVSSVKVGDTVTIEANTPPEGYKFKEWQIISGTPSLASATSAATTFVMPESGVSVKAVYEELPSTTYTITIADGTAKVGDQTASSAKAGDTVTITANAPSEGYKFKEWQVVSGSLALASAASASTTFTMPAENVSLKAVYEEDTPDSTAYTITVSDGDAKVDGKAATSAKSGETVTITAKAPAEGYKFKEWQIVSGSLTLASATSASTTFTMPAENVSLKAVYEEDTPDSTIYTITVADGTAKVGGKTAISAKAGETVTITAKAPASGYKFKEWQIVSGSPTLASAASASTTFTMPAANVSLKAVYEKDTTPEPDKNYTITVTDGVAKVENKTVTSAKVGDTVTVTANAPADGYKFKEWQIVSGSVKLASATSASTTFTMPASDVSLKAVYEKNSSGSKYTIIVTNGTAKVDGQTAGSAKPGDVVVITANDYDSYGNPFKKWVVNSGKITLADSASTTTTFTMPSSNVSVTAKYDDSKGPVIPTGENPAALYASIVGVAVSMAMIAVLLYRKYGGIKLR